jgi:hypothetical protein
MSHYESYYFEMLRFSVCPFASQVCAFFPLSVNSLCWYAESFTLTMFNHERHQYLFISKLRCSTVL